MPSRPFAAASRCWTKAGGGRCSGRPRRSASASACTPAACCSAAASTKRARSAAMAVNVAARMEQSAPAGGLRISHDTYGHVRGIFDVVAQAPIAVKGIAEPLVTYLVERARPRAFRVETRGIEGVPTPMVGREAELGRLQQAFRSCARDAVPAPGHRRRRSGHRQEPVAARVRRPDRDRAGTSAAAPGAGDAADAGAALRAAVRRDRLAFRHRRGRRDGRGATQARRRGRAAAPGRNRNRRRRGTRAPARPPDRHRFHDQPPRPWHRRRSAADPQPRRPRGRARAAPPRRDWWHAAGAAARRRALGRRRIARLHRPSRRCRAPTSRCSSSPSRGRRCSSAARPR